MRSAHRSLAFLVSLVLAGPGLFAAESRVQWVEVPAPSLAGNQLGSPESQRTAIYTPPSYDRDQTRRYPVVYLLHGIFDRPDVWTGHFGVPELLDRGIAAGRLPELIVVMPTASNVIGGGFYRNSTVAGAWGDLMRRDLVTFVDERFRTIPRRESRALAGHSMGGFGAIWHAMTSADIFAVAYAMSPGLLAIEDDISHGNSAGWAGMLEMGGMDGVEAALERRDLWPVVAWSVCTSFLPNPDDPVYLCDPPYRQERGELIPIEEVIDRWRSVLPLYTADEHVASLRSMRGLALDYGFDDQFSHIPGTTQSFSNVLADLRVAHDLFVYRGDHRQQLSHRLETVVFPWLAAHLDTGIGAAE